MTSQPPNLSPSEATQSKSQGWKSLAQTLQGRLLWTVIPAVILPLTLISAIQYNAANQQAVERNLARLAESSRLGDYNTTKFIDNIFNALTLTASSPGMVSALRLSATTAESQGLLAQNAEKLETQFEASKAIKPNPTLNTYLTQIADFEKLLQLSITDKNGFNVAYRRLPKQLIQRDTAWWQAAKEKERELTSPEVETTTNQTIIPLSESIRDPQTNEFLGVLRAELPTAVLEESLADLVSFTLQDSQVIQVIDSETSSVIDSVSLQNELDDLSTVIGGDAITTVIQSLHEGNLNAGIPAADTSESGLVDYNGILQRVSRIEGITNARFFELENLTTAVNSEARPLIFEYQDKVFTALPILNTEWGVVTAIDKSDFTSVGRQLLVNSILTTLLLAGLSALVIVILARNLSSPLLFLRQATMQAAEGDLEVKAPILGTSEMRQLGNSFNTLIDQVKESLRIQSEATEAQFQLREALEDDIVSLMEDMEGAVEGDLTVRADLVSQDMSTVADLFNAIIESLRDIATEVKQSTVQVSQSLEASEVMMQETAAQSSTEAEQVLQALSSVAVMSQSVQDVAERALQAALMSQDAYGIVQDGTFAMNQTVDSVLNLRRTVGETARKMKLLGESSQKISQVVSLIEEISLKTNLLAINASVEAGRAGEDSQGFSIVAEQVGALAEQSSAATKEIAALVANIQIETQNVSEAMERGTSQVVDSTQLIEQSKQSLEKVLQTSQDINELMQFISDRTNTQAITSKDMTRLMQSITKAAKTRSKSALTMATDLQSTVSIAQALQSTVQQFKVAKSDNIDREVEISDSVDVLISGSQDQASLGTLLPDVHDVAQADNLLLNDDIEISESVDLLISESQNEEYVSELGVDASAEALENEPESLDPDMLDSDEISLNHELEELAPDVNELDVTASESMDSELDGASESNLSHEFEDQAVDDDVRVDPDNDLELEEDEETLPNIPMPDVNPEEFEMTDSEIEDLEIEDVDLEEISQLTSQVAENQEPSVEQHE